MGKIPLLLAIHICGVLSVTSISPAAVHDTSSPLLSQKWSRTYSSAWATAVGYYDGCIYAVGSANIIPEQKNDILVLKYDPNGNLLWGKTWDRYPYDAAWGLDIYDEYLYVAGVGSDWHSALSFSNVTLLKYDMDGSLVWSQDFNSSPYDFAYSLIADENGLYSGGQSNGACCLIHYTLDGNYQWRRIYSETGELYSEVTDVCSSGDYVYAVGHTQDSEGDEDILLIQYDRDGSIVWSTTWEETGTQKATGVTAREGNIYVCGYGDILDLDATGILLKYDSTGTLSWHNSFGHFKLEAIEEDADTLYLVGQKTGYSPYPSEWDLVIARFDGENGNLIDYETINYGGCEIARGLEVSNSDLYIAGAKDEDALIIKYGFNPSAFHYSDRDRFPHTTSDCLGIAVFQKAEHTQRVRRPSGGPSEEAIGAANWLISLAETVGDGFKWPVSEEDFTYSTNLYDGVPGICLFLLRLYEATGYETYRHYAEGGMNWLISIAVNEGGGYKWPSHETSHTYYSGYYEGAAGIGSVFLDFYTSLACSTYLEYAEGAARWIESVHGIEGSHEIMMGAAGVGTFFLKLYDVTGEPHYLSYAQEGGDWVISHARECPVLFLTEVGNPLYRSSPVDHGFLWITSDIPYHWITSTGYAHGTSGPVYFLAELFRRSGLYEYLACAETGARWILHEAVIEGDGDMQWRWKYRLDQEYSPFFFATGWCYGIPGLGNAYMSLYEATGDSNYLKILQRGTDWLMEQAIPSNGGYRWIGWVPRVETKSGSSITHRCCGVAAVGYFLLDLYQLTVNPPYLVYGLGAIEWLKSVAVKTPEGYKWWVSTSYPVAYTGHHTGAAGIGLLLLREGVDIVLDNSDPQFTILSGSWKSGDHPKAHNGSVQYHKPGFGADKACWMVDGIIAPGVYDVYIWKFEHAHMNKMATDVHYKVRDRNGMSSWITIDQSTPGDEWIQFGSYEFDNSSSQGVLITDNANGFVIADALKLVYGGPLPDSATRPCLTPRELK